MPAKTVYSVPLHQAFIAKLENLNGFVRPACDACGISRSTMYRWRDLGMQGHEPYASLLADILRVQASKAEKRMAEVEAHALEDPATARWLAERTLPAELGLRDKVEQAAAEQLQALVDAVVGELDLDDPTGVTSERFLRAVGRLTGDAPELAEGEDVIETDGESVERRRLPSGDPE